MRYEPSGLVLECISAAPSTDMNLGYDIGEVLIFLTTLK